MNRPDLVCIILGKVGPVCNGLVAPVPPRDDQAAWAPFCVVGVVSRLGLGIFAEELLGELT